MKDDSSMNNPLYMSILDENFGIQTRENVEGVLKINLNRNLLTNQIKTKIKQGVE